VRDLLSVQRDRVLLTLIEDVPSLARMHRHERVALAGYGQEPITGAVAGLGVPSDPLARVVVGLTPTQLERRCVTNYRSPAVRDVAWLGRHSVHEARHHLGDSARCWHGWCRAPPTGIGGAPEGRRGGPSGTPPGPMPWVNQCAPKSAKTNWPMKS